MSIENRLTALQNKLEELVDLVKRQDKKSGQEDEDSGRRPYPSTLVELRTLELWKGVVAECLGSLCYVFFVCGVSIPWTGHFPPFLSIAFATALLYGALTYRVFPRAHLNPAFSMALTAIQKISIIRCILYVTAQCGGAIAGAAILFGFTTDGYRGTLGATSIASHVESIQAFGLELILTFVLTLTFISDPKNCVPTSSVLLAASLVALPCTGAGLNPVRSLGPAFVMNKWPKHWVFWLGPIIGALLAAYFHKYVLKRKVNKGGKDRGQGSDGDSLDIPPTELPVTTPDRLLCDRLEPIYGGTRSLYVKPSPVLPRTNLNRSQSVYASKRFEYPSKFLDSASTSKKMTTPHSETNYEPLYESRKPGLLLSGPPSYESSYHKTYEKSQSHAHAHHHHREKSDSSHHHCSRGDRERESQSHKSRILAQYETAKGFVDVDPKAAALRESKTSYYETSEILRKHGLMDPAEKKLIDTSSGSESGTTRTNSVNENRGDPPPPPRFRIPQQPPTPQESAYNPPPHRYHGVGQNTPGELHSNNLSRGNSINKHHGGGVEHPHHHQGQPGLTPARKPYEMLEGQKLMEFSPKCTSSGNGLTSPISHHISSVTQQQQANHYSPRLLMDNKDSNYSRILDPILSPKSSHSGNQSQSNKHQHYDAHHNAAHHNVAHQQQHQQQPVSHDEHLTYSYH